jgi:DNA-directed RNA polymerase subunit RPC12/RpoP
MNRIIPLEVKVKVIEEVLCLQNVEEIAMRNDVSPGAIRYWYNEKVLPSLESILENERPGPKPKDKESEAEITTEEIARPEKCIACGSRRIWKNGTYAVINWIWLLTVGWLIGIQRTTIQRFRCAVCGQELASPERQRQAEARRAWWQQVQRLIGLSRFKLGISVRKTQVLVAFVYGRQVAVGYIHNQTQQIGQQAQAVLERLKDCRQKAARFLLFDETFPKLGKRAYSLGVIICESGLIRSVRTLKRKAQEIPDQLQGVVGEHYQPDFFLTDLAITYGKHLERAGLSLEHLRDLVHLIRQIIRLFDDAVKEITLDTPKSLSYKQRRKQKRLKKRLLRKFLRPFLSTALKAFSPGYESVCVLMLEGVASQLRDPVQILQTSSVQRLTNRLERFIKKHGETINTLLYLSVTEDTPKTTSALESTNSRFKPFSLIAKSFRLATGQNFFAGVALMENFDVKSRGRNQGTNAIQRAGINLGDLDATDFFSAVALEKPQISLSSLTG